MYLYHFRVSVSKSILDWNFSIDLNFMCNSISLENGSVMSSLQGMHGYFWLNIICVFYLETSIQVVSLWYWYHFGLSVIRSVSLFCIEIFFIDINSCVINFNGKGKCDVFLTMHALIYFSLKSVYGLFNLEIYSSCLSVYWYHFRISVSKSITLSCIGVFGWIIFNGNWILSKKKVVESVMSSSCFCTVLVLL